MININSFEIAGKCTQIFSKLDKNKSEYLILVIKVDVEENGITYRTLYSVLVFNNDLILKIKAGDYLKVPIYASGTISNRGSHLALIGKRIMKR